MGWRKRAKAYIIQRCNLTNYGCWLWVGPTDKDGYPFTSVPREVTKPGWRRFGLRIQRLSYVAFREDFPESLVIDHLCRQRKCLNPAHLEPVTVKVNSLRGAGLTALNAVKTHCKNGHLFDESNTYLHEGRRRCRACRYQATTRYYQKDTARERRRQRCREYRKKTR